MTDTKDSLSIELDNYPGFYFPGHTVTGTGRVVRVVAKSDVEQIKYFHLEFHGEASVYWQTTETHGYTDGNNQYHSITTYHTHRNDQTYFNHKIQLGKTQNDGVWMTSLPRGRHSFPFIFVLPVGIPASYNDKKEYATCRIFYQAKATYRIPGFWKSEIKAVRNLNVRRPIDLNFFPSAARPRVITDEKYLCCWCCSSGPISFKLTFNKTGFLIGEKIEFLAELMNHSNAEIKSAQVWISRWVKFHATDGHVQYEMYDKDLGDRLSLPTDFSRDGLEVIPVSLKIPNHQQINSYGCSFMESIYELRVKIIIPCGINLKGRLPIVIGVVPFIIPPRKF